MKRTAPILFILSAFLTLFLFPSAGLAATFGRAPVLQAQESPSGGISLEVIADSNVREGPDESYPVIGRAGAGETLLATGLSGEWYIIEFDGLTAYIHSSRVSVLPQASPDAEPTPTPQPSATPTPQPQSTATPEPSQTPQPEVSALPSWTPEESEGTGEEDVPPAETQNRTTLYLAIACAIFVVIIILIVRQRQFNAEVLLPEGDSLRVVKRLSVHSGKVIFIDVTKYVMFQPLAYVRIYQGLIEQANAPIYVQVGDKVIEANMLSKHGENYSITKLHMNWDNVELRP